ncbi:MAG TPA: peptidase S10 [Thermoanaerobaculia bacterium]|nr:peptidase S10 [Thermoanaerobaculia bacterium]
MQRSGLPIALLLLPLCLLALPVHGQGAPDPAPAAGAPPAHREDKEKDREKKPAPPPEEKVSQTHHTLTLGGQTIAYTATAGTLLLRDDDETPRASFFYIAYIKDGVKDPHQRPVTFSFNGGPGSASLWVHLGAFGPKALARDPEGRALPPPGHLVDNDLSLLDTTDLVFIDPIWTGYSRPLPGEDVKKFTGLENDVKSVAEFIRLWTSRNERWASPKLLAGESYGTTRAAGLARYLDDRYGLQLNGLILVSSILNWQDQDFHVGNDMPYLLILPTYTATAWYYQKLPPELSGDLRRTLDEVEAFALHDYALALLAGDRLPAGERREIATRLARYTGLSVDYVLRANLRVELERFTKELLRDQGKTVGRLDTRFTGWDLDAAGETPEYDPASAAVNAPYAGAVNDYLRRELGFKSDLVYEYVSNKVRPWSFEPFHNQYVNVAEYLRQEMNQNPEMKVLIVGGHYDLATPYFDSVYTMDHLGLPPELRGNIRMIQYEAGHMMYIRRSEHEKLKRDLTEFITAVSGGAKPR